MDEQQELHHKRQFQCLYKSDKNGTVWTNAVSLTADSMSIDMDKGYIFVYNEGNVVGFYDVQCVDAAFLRD